jgi:ribosome-binding ATPase
MKLGLIGLNNTGKTTLFNAITRSSAAVGNYFSSSKPNIGKVPIPDKRLEELAAIFNPKKTTPASIEFVDIAGIASGPVNGRRTGNSFLMDVREVDALVHVVDFFSDESIAYYTNNNSLSCIETINIELMISDLELIEKRIESIEKKKRVKDSTEKTEMEILIKIKDSLDKGIPARNLNFSENESRVIKSFNLLTLKPVIYCINVAETYLKNDAGEPGFIQGMREFAQKDGSVVITVCAKIEEEISKLEPEYKDVFMKDMQIEESGLDKLIKASYELLGFISFLTAGTDEVRAWTIKKNEKAPKAAGKIHSDIERGFIRAETVSFIDFMESGGSFLKAKEKGLMRSEGKDYIVKDGDIIDFRFNV